MVQETDTIFGSPVRLHGGDWGVMLQGANHAKAATGRSVLVSTRGGKIWTALLGECVFTMEDGPHPIGVRNARKTCRKMLMPQAGRFEGSPARCQMARGASEWSPPTW